MCFTGRELEAPYIIHDYVLGSREGLECVSLGANSRRHTSYMIICFESSVDRGPDIQKNDSNHSIFDPFKQIIMYDVWRLEFAPSETHSRPYIIYIYRGPDPKERTKNNSLELKEFLKIVEENHLCHDHLCLDLINSALAAKSKTLEIM